MWFLPKDYVWVHTRVEKAHDKHNKNLSIKTEFDIKENTVIFKAEVYIKDTDQTFNWSAFWEVWKEKAFEKLETVAVWRALAFAWFEVKDWIASWEEMQRFQSKQETETKPKYNNEDVVWLKSSNNICPQCDTENEIKKAKSWKSYFKCSNCESMVWITTK